MSTNLKLLNAIIKLKKEIEAIKKDRPRDGVDGINGLDGRPGIDGVDGKPGKDGVGIKDAYINQEGHLILVLTNDKEIDCGKCQGENTVKTIRSMGRTSNSIKDAKIVNGELIITLENGKTINAGSVVAEPGEITEKDPIFSNSPAESITNENIENWNNKVDKTELENLKSVKFETILGENYSLISTTANYEETIQAFENKKMVYSTMVCEGVENGYMYPTEWKTQMDDPYISFVYHFRKGHEINEVWMHIRKSGNNTTEWRILENSQMKRTYETGWQEVPDDEHYVSERLLVDTFNNFQALGDKVQSVKDYAGSEVKYPSSKAVAEYTDSQCGVVLDYMQTTFAQNIMNLVGLSYTKKPVIIYDNANGFEASNDDAGDTWHLTGLDLKPYKRLKFYVRSGGDADANYSPSHIVEMHLDDRAKGSFGYFSADHAGHCPNNRNRHHIVTFIVNAEKTAIQFQHSISIYGTAASNSAGGRSCYLIEGYYD